MYNIYPLYQVILRRSAVILLGMMALPIMLCRSDRARFYSYLHRVWLKTSDKPVWLDQAELTGGYFY